ncbi:MULTISPECIES: glutathione S-transferase family protein [unclassified Leisingera]|uniref:glutathione S-transferase family protein n=1 Tax=unclassified Leisingera TaxID=2614906 RepID=UPI0021A84D14|nr:MULTISPECIES: glutathione S-transferase family protein [unclassified Leisingera]UWQ30009.1 glutathione S-transferase family protein [Leisingera sp. M523]UWQ76172.1 glutathione S-transferase family protein [Leisingera sp. M658]
MKLITAEYCPFSLRCVLALREKRQKFELLTVNLAEKTQFGALLSPYGRVPVLEHNGNSIYESSVINEYLEEVFPEPALLPGDPYNRAAARFWIDFCNTRFMPAYFNLLKSVPGKTRDALRAELLEHLAFIEDQGLSQRAADQPFWLSGRAGLVDFSFYPFFERFADVEVFRNVEIPHRLENLQKWLKTMRGLPSVQSIMRSRAHYIAYFRTFYAD